MKTARLGCVWALTATTLLALNNAAWSADSPRLAAPLYPGAVPAIPAEGIKKLPPNIAVFGGVKALPCIHDPFTNERPDLRWCFMTRDPIDKVKAFYEKSVGPLKRYEGDAETARVNLGGSKPFSYAQYTERAWFDRKGEDGGSNGFYYHGVSLHALKPLDMPRRKVAAMGEGMPNQDAYAFYAGSRHFNGFMNGMAWFGPDPSKRDPAELDALFKKRGRLEAAIFRRKGEQLTPVDETLRARYGKKQEQAMESAQGALMQQIQMPQQPMQAMPANQSATPEDAQFNAFMRKNPKVAQRYTELTQKISTLMMQGKFDEADAADEELEKLVQSHPELAALENRAEERSAAAGAAHQAQENQMMANMNKQMDQAIWGTWMEYLAAVEKEAYYTLIVIDEGYQGNEKDYSRDRARFDAAETANHPHSPVYGFKYDAGAGQTRQAAGNTSPAAQPAASTEEQPKAPQDEIKDAAKKGLKALKKLF